MTETATRPVAPPRTGALDGLRVVELGFAAAGPLVGKYLANFGAEVIRLESRSAADVFRTTYPPFKDGVVAPDRAGMFAFYNDGKRSATLNLKHPKGVALARALIGRADVFVESFTPGTVARLGLVRAVEEAALRRELLDVRERRFEPLVRDPELELAHPGRVDDEASSREKHELAVRGRVAAAAVGSKLSRLEQLLAGEAVHERRLPHA